MALKSIKAFVDVPASFGQKAQELLFLEPTIVWQAENLTDLRNCLDKVEDCQLSGLYVVGFVSYEAAPAFDSAMKAKPQSSLPLAWFAAFANATPPLSPPVNWRGKITPPKLKLSQTDYATTVKKALDYIAKGDIYQVNYTMRADIELFEDPFSRFLALRQANPVPHSAFMDTGEALLLSLSPELFLRKRRNILESRPMKGTAAREPSWEADETARVALEQDEKNRAENTMIVDLVRNDLGRVCESGSVHVPELCTVQRFPTVHQMTSLVRGTLREGVSLYDIFQASFPPESVTGAPKIRAMEIISELETEPRGIYCGTIGIFFPNGDFECNVAIRTIEVSGDSGQIGGSASAKTTTLGLGSGIVADSEPEIEWQECLLKGKFVTQESVPEFNLLETFRYIPDDGYRFLELHLKRLENSCNYFNLLFPLKEILHDLENLKEQIEVECKVRLELSKDGLHLKASTDNMDWPEEELRVWICKVPVNSKSVWLYHKTTNREVYNIALELARSYGAYEALLQNERGELTEGAISSVFLKINGEWLTPKLTCGLLPCIWRENELREGRAREAVLTVQDLQNADEIRVANSSRGEKIVSKILY